MLGCTAAKSFVASLLSGSGAGAGFAVPSVHKMVMVGERQFVP